MIILNNTATKVASLSAAADFLDADKHLNLKKAQTAGTKIAVAAERFAKAHAKGDAVAAKQIAKLGAKTAKQIEKALKPIGYYYIGKKAKVEAYSAAKAKKGDATYLRKRAIRVMSRKNPSDAYTLVAPIYNNAILNKEALAIQRDLIKAIEQHSKGTEKTKARASEITQATQSANTADFRKSADLVIGTLLSAPASKLKQANIFESTPMRGVPAVYINVPGAGVLVLRHATKAQLAAAKKASANASTSADDEWELSESARDVNKAAFDSARSKAFKNISKADVTRFNSIVAALGFPSVQVKTKRFTHMGMPQATAITGDLAPNVSKFGKIAVSFADGKVSVSVRPRSFMGSAYETWTVAEGLPFDVAGIAKGLRKAGVKVSADAVKAAKKATGGKYGSFSSSSESAGVNRAAPTYKQIVSQQAKSCKDSGATVEYSRAEGSYFIECDGDTIELRNDDAEEFGKTVKKYKSYNISEQEAMLAAAWPWVQNM